MLPACTAGGAYTPPSLFIPFIVTCWSTVSPSGHQSHKGRDLVLFTGVSLKPRAAWALSGHSTKLGRIKKRQWLSLQKIMKRPSEGSLFPPSWVADFGRLPASPGASASQEASEQAREASAIPTAPAPARPGRNTCLSWAGPSAGLGGNRDRKEGRWAPSLPTAAPSRGTAMHWTTHLSPSLSPCDPGLVNQSGSDWSRVVT